VAPSLQNLACALQEEKDMARTLCVASLALWLLGTAIPARADGANIARFLVQNSLQVRPPTPFEKAFATLRAARGRAGPKRVLLSTTTRHQIRGVTNGLKRTKMTGKRELLFDGKRAYLRLSTSSHGLRPNVTSRTMRVPLGRMFGWYGRSLLKASFPELTPKKMQQALSQQQR
jgi:hypothetical protein